MEIIGHAMMLLLIVAIVVMTLWQGYIEHGLKVVLMTMATITGVIAWISIAMFFAKGGFN